MSLKLFSFIWHKILKLGLIVPVFVALNFAAQYASVFENVTDKQGLPSNYIFGMGEDHEGTMWMGSDKGLIKYSNGEFKTIDADSGLPGNYVNLLVPDGKRGLLLYLSEKGLYYFDSGKEKITVNYTTFGSNVPGLQIYKSVYNKEFLLVSVNKENRVYAINRNNPRKITLLYKEKDPAGKNNFKYYLNNGDKKILLATTNALRQKTKITDGEYNYEIIYGKGILRTKDGKPHDILDEKKGLGSSLISGSYKSNSGDIYFTSYGGGLSIIKKNNRRLLFDLDKLNVRAINTENGKYYILSEGYLYTMNREKVLSKVFLKRDALTLYIKDQYLYLGSFSGLDKYKILPDNTLKHLSFFPLTAGISKIRQSEGKIVFSTYGSGVYEESADGFTNIQYPAFNNIENFFQNHNYNFVITSSESGFSLLDPNLGFIKNFDKKDGLPSNNVSFTYGEPDTLWVGTKKGLSAFVNRKLVKNFTEKEGFTGSNVRIMFRSHQNELWIVTDKMILKKSGNRLKPLGSLNFIGNTDEHIMKSIYWKDLNELSIATDENFSLINLNDIRPDEKPPVPVLEKIIVDDEETAKNTKLELQADNYLTELLFKPVDKNILTKTELFYQLDANKWEKFSIPNILRFHHMEPGTYKVKIKTVNSDGYEKEYPETLTLKVFPHFYKTWWFIIGIFLLFGLISLLMIYDYYRRKFENRMQQIAFRERLEQERKRISRDLHDNIGAYTTSLIHKVDDIKQHIPDPQEEKKLDDIRENASFIMSLLRQTIWVLSAKEISLEGFYDNLVNYVHKIVLPEQDMKVTFKEEIHNSRILESTSAITLFRILQEAFHNILKHSEASQVEFRINSADRIFISVKDNGKGFRLSDVKKGYGLTNMQERAEEAGYQFHIATSEGEGTTITLSEIKNT